MPCVYEPFEPVRTTTSMTTTAAVTMTASTPRGVCYCEGCIAPSSSGFVPTLAPTASPLPSSTTATITTPPTSDSRPASMTTATTARVPPTSSALSNGTSLVNTSTTTVAPASTVLDATIIAGGVAGFIAALLLLVGVAAFLVWRRHRSTSAHSGTAIAPPQSLQYASTSAAFRPNDAPRYDSLTANEAVKSHYAATGAIFKSADAPHYVTLAQQEATPVNNQLTQTATKCRTFRI
jgi:hypothetical protein